MGRAAFETDCSKRPSMPGYEASTWSGVGAPKATAAEIVEKLNNEINAALADHRY
jgi:tripartite-type tricarboxylate transporter receptor subunit TctC